VNALLTRDRTLVWYGWSFQTKNFDRNENSCWYCEASPLRLAPKGPANRSEDSFAWFRKPCATSRCPVTTQPFQRGFQ
jgi:hypothetical protein